MGIQCVEIFDFSLSEPGFGDVMYLTSETMPQTRILKLQTWGTRRVLDQSPGPCAMTTCYLRK